MLNGLIFFACGIGFKYLLDLYEEKKNFKFKCGESEACKNCNFKNIVLDSLDNYSNESDNA